MAILIAFALGCLFTWITIKLVNDERNKCMQLDVAEFNRRMEDLPQEQD